MRFTTCIAMLFLLLTIAAPIASADIIGTSDEEVRSIAEPVLDSILEGFKTNNYTKYSKDFDATLKEAVPEDKFLELDTEIDKSMGNCVEKEYLGFLSRGRMTMILWKAKFAKPKEEVLIQLLMSKRGEDYLVTGLWFK